MGFDDPCFGDTEDDMIRTLLDSEHPFVKGITLEQLDREHFVRLNSRTTDAVPAVCRGRVRYALGQVRLWRGFAGLQPPVESRLGIGRAPSRYPLELISPKNDDSMNSTFGNRSRDRSRKPPFLPCAQKMRRRAALLRGDRVRVFNDRGCLCADGRGGWTWCARAWSRAPSVRWGKRSPDGARYERSGVRAADRHGRRADLL